MTSETATKFMGILDQKEVQYTPVSITPGKACSSCIWYRGNFCHIVANSPEEIVPNGYCNRHEVASPLAPQDIEPIPVVIVEPPMMEDDSAEMALPTTRRGLKALIVDMFKRTPDIKPEQAFTVWKGQSDKWYWMSRHTGKWVDREDEIIADHSHDEYVTRVQKGLVPLPELWTWHKKGTMHGQADFVWKAGGFTLAIGHLVGTKEQVERAAKYYEKMGDKIKLSHMFKYPKQGKRGKVYHAYNTVEITTLPDGAEAFPYTTFEGLGNMPFTKEQEDQIRAIGGDEMWQRAQAADSKALTDTAKLDAAGVSSKNVSADNFEGSKIPEDDEVKALGVATKDMDTRLKTLEALPALITTLDSTIKGLQAQLATSQQAAADALAKANANEKALLEYQALAPPASQSNDTLLDARNKSLLEQLSESVKSDGAMSMIEQAMGKAPAVSA